MKVLVDTPIWSLVFRRRWHSPHSTDAEIADRLKSLIDEDQAVMLGPIRQEILSGIREQKQFEALREALQGFTDLALTRQAYEKAAEFFNICRKKGIQGSNTDYLICAAAFQSNAEIFTTDKDFTHYLKHLPISVYAFDICF